MLTSPKVLSPLSADILSTIGILVVSETFPVHTQALASAVINTFSILGTSIGFASMSVISAGVTKNSKFADKSSPKALMVGYRATFWALFAWNATALVVGAVGLRKLGKVGVKRD